MKDRRPKRIRPRIRPERTCAYCNSDIPADHEVFGFGAKARLDADVERYRGGPIEIAVSSLNRSVIALVVGRDSPAARERLRSLFRCVQ
jgi:hypothetical protein